MTRAQRMEAICNSAYWTISTDVALIQAAKIPAVLVLEWANSPARRKSRPGCHQTGHWEGGEKHHHWSLATKMGSVNQGQVDPSSPTELCAMTERSLTQAMGNKWMLQALPQKNYMIRVNDSTLSAKRLTPWNTLCSSATSDVNSRLQLTITSVVMKSHHLMWQIWYRGRRISRAVWIQQWEGYDVHSWEGSTASSRARRRTRRSEKLQFGTDTDCAFHCKG